MNKFTKYFMWTSFFIAITFFILFDCQNRFAPLNCRLLHELETMIQFGFFVAVFLGVWTAVQAFIIQFEFQREYEKTSKDPSLSYVALIFGNYLTVECDEIRKDFLSLLWRSFLILIPWLLIMKIIS